MGNKVEAFVHVYLCTHARVCVPHDDTSIACHILTAGIPSVFSHGNVFLSVYYAFPACTGMRVLCYPGVCVRVRLSSWQSPLLCHHLGNGSHTIESIKNQTLKK